MALLLGVRVRLGCDVDALNTALKSPAQLDALDTALPDQRRLAAFSSSKGTDWRLDVLVDASGGRCSIFDHLGFAQTVALRSARAIGIVISLVNRKSPAELELRESTWSSQYFQHEFRQLELTAGVVLENLVYYRSSGAFADAATHYFVMTTSQDALQAFGALRDPRVTEATIACAPANVDRQRLEAYARAAIVAFVPALGEQPLVPGQLSVFDFSSRRQSSQAAAVVPGAVLGGRQETCCLVTRVGDALQEPFWVRRWLPVSPCISLDLLGSPWMCVADPRISGSCYLLLTNHAGGSTPVPTARRPRHQPWLLPRTRLR